jgi:hypothetical protein
MPTGLAALVSATLAAALALGSTGCPSFSTLQTPRTVPKGKFRQALGLHMVSLRTNDGSKLILPVVEAGGRYGISDAVDIGGKFAYAGYFSAEGGLKFQVVRGALDVALAPAVSFLAFNGGSQGEENGFTFFHLHLPLLMGMQLSDDVVLGFGPKFLYSTMKESSSGTSSEVLFSGTNLGGFVNLPIEIGRGFWIAPEINVYTPARDFGGSASVQGGLTFMYGGHEFRQDPNAPPPVYYDPSPGSPTPGRYPPAPPGYAPPAYQPRYAPAPAGYAAPPPPY